MPAITNRTVARLAALTMLAALATSGCGSDTPASDPQTTQAQTNGLEKKSAAQVQLEAAAAALKTAKSVHVRGTGLSEDTPVQIDLRLQGDSSTGTIEQEDIRLEVTVIGDDTYIKASRRAWRDVLGAPAWVQRSASQWVKIPTEQANLTGFSLSSFAGQLAVNDDGPLVPTVEQTTLDGKKVVVISQQNGSKLYMANTGPPTPLRGEYTSPSVGRLDFTEYGRLPHHRPTNAIDITEAS